MNRLARFTIIAAHNAEYGIGYKGGLPWPSDIKEAKDDMNAFKIITTQKNRSGQGKSNACIMGKSTFISMKNPLKNRWNVILSTTMNKFGLPDNCVVFDKFLDALEFCSANASKTFVIGGERVYKEAYEKYNFLCDEVITNVIPGKYQCDKFLKIPDEDTRTHEEQQYLDICREILACGELRVDRTGTGVKGLFGKKMVFDLRKGFPLLTTKKVFFSAIVKELLFFISGKTDTKILADQGVHIWDGNTSSDFLAKRNLDYREGDMGAGYSFQWRHCGEEYKGCDEKYGGIDQLSDLIEGLKNDPYSRRHMLVAWNVKDLPKMALPPCHCLAQFYVSKDPLDVDTLYLDCCMFQRSADMFLGVPFNIASYALLMTIIAKTCGFTPRYYHHELGDAHIYLNHLNQMETQISRYPLKFPTLYVNNDNIFDVKFDDIRLHEYVSHPAIHGKMSI